MNTIKQIKKYVFLISLLIGFLVVFTGCLAELNAPTPIQVTKITVTGANGATSVTYGGILQMSAAVLPADATDPSVTWSVVNGTLGSATISETGLLTATGVGDVTVKATANDGSGSEGTLEVPVSEASPLITIMAIPGVTPPATGETPNLLIMETAQYTGTVAWMPNDIKYVDLTVYTATITLTAKAGFTLTGVAANSFTVAGATSVTNEINSGVVTAVFPAATVNLSVARVELGTAGEYAILAQTTITATGVTHITGDLGLSPAAASFFTGFDLTKATGYATSALVTGNMYAADMAPFTPTNLTTAVSNMLTAYNNAKARSTTPDVVDGQAYLNLGAGAIGGLTLAPGVYTWGSTVNINSALTLAGGADDVWIFQIANNLNLAKDINVVLSGEAKAENVFWQVAEIATLGTSSHMEGIILSKTDIVLQTGSSINGRLLAQTQVTLDAATVVEPVI